MNEDLNVRVYDYISQQCTMEDVTVNHWHNEADVRCVLKYVLTSIQTNKG